MSVELVILNLLGHDVWVSAHRLAVIFLPIMLDAEAVPKFMRNGESQGETGVFVDVTAPVRLAHS